MVNKINLRNVKYIFSDDNLVLKEKNVIFGYNGTGKTSIVNTIKQQLEDTKNPILQIYTGFSEYISEDESLDTITLGKENVTIKKRVDGIDKEIKELKKELNDKVPNSLSYKNFSIQKEIEKKERSLDRIKSKVAKNIKEEHTRVVGTTFFKPHLEKYIDNRKILNDEEFEKYNNEIIYDSEISSFNKINFSNIFIDLDDHYNDVKDIVSTSLKPSTKISELIDRPDKQNFARKGMEIHSRKENEICAFCGNKISKNRWDELDHFFSDETNSLLELIKEKIGKIKSDINKIDTVELIDVNQFYFDFQNKIIELNNELSLLKERTKNYLQSLIDSLTEKKENLFSDNNSVQHSTIAFKEFVDKYEKVYDDNLEYKKNLSKIKKEAKEQLIRHYVYISLKNTDFEMIKSELSNLKIKKCEQDIEIQSIEDELNKYLNQKEELLLKTKDESKAANKINELLSYAGSKSFQLKLRVGDGDKNEYKIIDKNGMERSIKTLSTGEKNALAFMYFMYKLKDLGNNDYSNFLVVIDDPVNSNDARYQSIIYGYLEGHFSEPNCPQTILLTHNIDFYKKFTTSKNKYGNNSWNFIHLDKDRDGQVIINYIKKSSDDFSNEYDLLWKELKKQYFDKDVFLMWNISRRILESYAKFTSNKGIADFKNIFNKEDENYVKFVAFYTELNENSHSILNGHESDVNEHDIVNFLKKMLITISGEEGEKHFNTYFKI